MEEPELEAVIRFADFAVDALAAQRAELDSLNVFPVADGDTGTNLYLTAAAARDSLREAGADGPLDAAGAATAYARGALLGARGNSGTILAEMIGAGMRVVARAGAGDPGTRVLADALVAAAEAAYAAVGQPIEGTMLTVLREAAAAADRAATGGASVYDVVAAATDGARVATARTPEQLPALGGRPDAGARGVVAVLDALDTALTGRRPLATPHQQAPVVIAAPHAAPGHEHAGPGGPAYEVMYLLETDDAAIPALREALQPLGDSLVVSGGDGLWNVHVHVDQPGTAVEAGLEFGHPRNIRITHLEAAGAEEAPRLPGRAVVAVSAGPGLSRIFREAGAVVVEGGIEHRASSARLLDAMLNARVGEIVLLPNDAATLRAAEAAAHAAETDHGITVAVIPTQAQVQGLAALAVHQPDVPFGRDVLEMTATARHARHGAVTVARQQAITTAGPCEAGDALGVIDGDFVRVGEDLAEVATDVLGRLVGGGGELVTLVSGADDTDGRLAEQAAAWLAEHHPVVDVVTYDGGQERYPLLVAVE